MIMSRHVTRGREGEDLACSYLEKKGFEVQLRNWRCSHYEIDIIATRDGTVHFVEVKTRHSLDYGFPEESVSRKKFNNMTKAASLFLMRFPDFLRIQYDIISILRLPGKPVEVLLFEDVYM